MLIFFVVALVMLLGALAFVVVPLLRAGVPAEPVSGTGSSVAIYKSQRRELDDELARGAITPAEHEVALGELSSRLVDEVPAEHATSSANLPARGKPWWLVAVIASVVPLGASLLYGAIGAPQAIDMATAAGGPAAHAGAAGEEPPMSDKQILAMVDALSQKMQQNPNDPRGWILLARSQNALGKFAEASAAFERAVALTPNDAQLLADFADATTMTQQGRFEGKPIALIKQALGIDPNNMKALALAGTAELRMGNRAASLLHWEKLKTLVTKDSADFREVESIIAEVKTTKIDAAGTAPSPVAMAPALLPPAVAPLPVAPAPAASPAKPGAKVTGKVVIAPELAAKLAPSDILFVFARAKEGPRLPLAVMRVPVPKANAFPVSFELTDAMAMAPGVSLSAFTEVVIEARISKSGNAQLQPGDLSGLSDVIKPGASGVNVTIGKVAP